MEPYNLLDGELELDHDQPGFGWRGTRVGPRIGATLLGGSVYELPPGERTWPYHFHAANEEWLLVLDGSPTMREPDGERALARGDVVCFPCGSDGAHQLRNDTTEPARFLLLSTSVTPEVVEYPDSGKIGVRSTDGRYLVAREPELGYWDGES